MGNATKFGVYGQEWAPWRSFKGNAKKSFLNNHLPKLLVSHLCLVLKILQLTRSSREQDGGAYVELLLVENGQLCFWHHTFSTKCSSKISSSILSTTRRCFGNLIICQCKSWGTFHICFNCLDCFEPCRLHTQCLYVWGVQNTHC